jgi:hypothetical protein
MKTTFWGSLLLLTFGSLGEVQGASPPVAAPAPSVKKPPSPVTPSLAPAIASVTVTTNTIETASAVAATVTFTSAASADGYVVVSSSNAGAARVTFQTLTPSVNPANGQTGATAVSQTPAASVNVPVKKGATTAPFQILVNSLSAALPVVITASAAGGGSASASITVKPYAVTSISVPADAPLYWDRDSTLQGRLFLAGPAPAGGRTLALGLTGWGGQYSLGQVVLPGSVTVPAGANSVTFPIQVMRNNGSTYVRDTWTKIAPTDYPAVIGTMNVHGREVVKTVVSPGTIQSGQSATVTVTLDEAAPPGGYVLNVNWMAAVSSYNLGGMQITFGQLSFQSGKTTASTTVSTTAAGPKLSPSTLPIFIQPFDNNSSNRNQTCVLNIQ